MSEHALSADCPLCPEVGGTLVWQGAWMRLIRAVEPLHPAFYRLVWQDHVAELSQLEPLQRAAMLDALVLVEQATRETLAPDKINLASLGNMVPHLHWHVIARWRDDPHWPQPVWAAQQRETDPDRLLALRESLPALDLELAARLSARLG